MTFTDSQNLIACLVTLALMPVPVILSVSVLVRLLFPKYDHRQ